MIQQKIIRNFYSYNSEVKTEELDLLIEDGYIIKSISSSMTEETKWSTTRCCEVILLEKETKDKAKGVKL
jgi:hypothetical protein